MPEDKKPVAYNDDTRLTRSQIGSTPGGWLSPKYTPEQEALWHKYQTLTFGQKATLKELLDGTQRFPGRGYITGKDVDLAAMQQAQAPAPALAGEEQPDTGDDDTEYASLAPRGLDNPLTRRRRIIG